MRSLFHSFLFLAFGVLSGFSQDAPVSGSDNPTEKYLGAFRSISEDLEESLEKLAELRESIAAEKIPLARRTNETASELREAKRRAEVATTRKDAVEAEFETAEADLKAWKEEKAYIESLLLDFGQSYEASLPLARLEEESGLLRSLDLESRLKLVENSLSQLEDESPATYYPGEASSTEGVMLPGTFVEVGPLRWFLADDRSRSGIVTQGRDLRPAVVEGSTNPEDLDALIQGREASPAFDPTLGTAVALTQSDESLMEHIRKGGFWIYPILLLAAIALTTAILKWIQLARIRSLPASRIQEILGLVRQGESMNALNELSTIAHPAARVLARGVQAQGNEIASSTERDDIEEAMYETFLEQQPKLQRGLPFIAIAAATAPLLGLLGTVTGMIETFRLINIFGTGDAKNLASGISEALVTTEFGLIVAIPSLILHALLSRKTQGIKSTMEMASLAFLNGIQPDPKPATAR